MMPFAMLEDMKFGIYPQGDSLENSFIYYQSRNGKLHLLSNDTPWLSEWTKIKLGIIAITNQYSAQGPATSNLQIIL